MSILKKTNLKDIISRFSGKIILVVGDVMLDEYVWGRVTRFSPEAPVPIVEVYRKMYAVGGAGNAAANIASLGGTPVLGGLIGLDEQGLTLHEELDKLNIDAEGLFINSEYPTITKTRIIAQEQQIARLDIERKEFLKADIEDKLIKWAEERMKIAEVCVISDYGKNVVSEKVAESIIKIARNYNKPVVVDPKGNNYKKYRGATVITPNIQEAEVALNIEIKSNKDISNAGSKFNKILQGGAVLFTRGSEGMALYLNDAKLIEIPAVARHLYDVTGAGDTVVGALSLSMAAGATLEEASYLANQAAGLVVEKIGTATVTIDELIQRLGQSVVY